MSTNTTTYPFDLMFDRMLGLGRTMDQAFAGHAAGTPPGASRPQRWLPAVDTYETENAFVVEADLPGVHQEDIDVNFEQGMLTMTGRRAPTLPATDAAKEGQQLRVYSSERLSGTFSRSVRLPEYVDGEKIRATYTNGVLTVHIPKATGALPRKISVQLDSGSADPKHIAG